MFALLGGIKSAISLLAGALVAAGIFWLWNTAYDNPRIQRAAMAEGQAIERRAWEAEMAKVKDEADRARRVAQAAIDERERRYLAEREADRKRHAAAVQSLEDELAAMEAEDNAEGAPAPVRPAIPARLSKSLDAVGKR